MEAFPKDIQLIVHAYMRPSEILSEYPLAEQEVFLGDTKEAWEFWMQRAYVAFGVSREQFVEMTVSPYAGYLQLYMTADRIDYGCEQYEALEHCVFKAIKEGDIPLLTYFYDQVKQLKMEDIPRARKVAEHKNMSVTAVFTNAHCYEYAAGLAPNFPEVIAFLADKGLSDLNIEVAWLICYIERGDYAQASSLMRNDEMGNVAPAGGTIFPDTTSLADVALGYVLHKHNLSLARKLLADFHIREQFYCFLVIAMDTDMPEFVQLIVDAFYAEDITIYERIIAYAQSEKREKVFAYYSSRKISQA